MRGTKRYSLTVFERVFAIVLILLALLCCLTFVFYNSITSIFVPRVVLPELKLFTVIAYRTDNADVARILSQENKTNGGGGYIVRFDDYAVVGNVFTTKKSAEKHSENCEVLEIFVTEKKLEERLDKNTVKELSKKSAFLSSVILEFAEMNEGLCEGSLSAGDIAINISALRTKVLDLKSSLFYHREGAPVTVKVLDKLATLYLNTFETALDARLPISSNISGITAMLLINYAQVISNN